MVTLPEDLLQTLRTKCAAKANSSLIGRIQGKHPGLKALTAWARETLHPSLTQLSLEANNMFEVTFSQPEGRIHALIQTELTCNATPIFFSSWKPHFNSKAPQDQLDFPVWVQIVDLCFILREDTFLRTVGEQIGQVIAVDNSEAYWATVFGPRIRLLVRDLKTLPQSVVLPRLDGEGVVEHKLVYSGLPIQCGRCRSTEHSVRFCPKKDLKLRRGTYQPRKPQPQTAGETPTQAEVTPDKKTGGETPL